MKTWLAVETATEACSVALAHGGEIWEAFELAPNRHSELLLPMLDGLLRQSGLTLRQVEAIACGVGPGGFTAVRLGITTAQALAQAMDLPLYPVSSLQALAAGVAYPQTLVALDARKGEVYAACYRRTQQGAMPRLDGEERVLPPGALDWPPAGDWQGIGSGWGVYASHWQAANGGPPYVAEIWPRARQVLELARERSTNGDFGQHPSQVEPHYIRPSQAEEGR